MACRKSFDQEEESFSSLSGRGGQGAGKSAGLKEKECWSERERGGKIFLEGHGSFLERQVLASERVISSWSERGARLVFLRERFGRGGDSTCMLSVSWISLLPYRFVYDFWGLLSFCLFILMFEYEHLGFYYVLVESRLVCLHFMLGF